MANGVLALFEAVGVGQAEIDSAILESAEVHEAVIAKAKAVQEYWQSIAPENKTGRPHTLKSGYVDEPGDYRKSIQIVYEHKDSGYFSAIVRTLDYKAHWLEYGSIHNPEFGFAQRVVDYFGGTALSNDLNGSNTYYVGA